MLLLLILLHNTHNYTKAHSCAEPTDKSWLFTCIMYHAPRKKDRLRNPAQRRPSWRWSWEINWSLQKLKFTGYQIPDIWEAKSRGVALFCGSSWTAIRSRGLVCGPPSWLTAVLRNIDRCVKWIISSLNLHLYLIIIIIYFAQRLYSNIEKKKKKNERGEKRDICIWWTKNNIAVLCTRCEREYLY